MGLVWMGLLVVCVTVTLTDAECHCNTTDACAVFPSTPCSQVGSPDECQRGWFGSYCQTQNIALGRTCSQSSILNSQAINYRAELAVDGRATTDARSTPQTCAHTRNETNPTWTVNLNTSRPEKIQHIRLYLRDDLQERNNGMEILVGSQMCYNWSSTEHPPPTANVTCRQPLTGTTVTIRIPGALKFLTLCEVQIFVCSNGWFGEDCDRQCQCLNGIEICDKITGHCSSGCSPGVQGDSCLTACPEGRYGANCASQCGHCLDTDACDRFTGKCPSGCLSGWFTNLCSQACQDGSYGINCSSQCGNCLNEDVCAKTTGTCPRGCASGWTSDTCLSSCRDGHYGVNCRSQCGHCLDTDVCDKVTGKCPSGCQPGWWPDLCSQACSDGRHGHHCQSDCGQCKGNLPCNKSNGTCDQGCQPGFQEPTCKECVDGMYGDDCMSRCGQCKDALTCDKSSGECAEGCQGHFVKPLCQECVCSATPECLNREAPVVATLVTLLVLMIIALLSSIFYNRRLTRQMAASLKKVEDNYNSLDEKTKDPVVENTYEHIDHTSPYVNAEGVHQGRI